jgi:AcrR family transcriptional regulator
MKRKYDTSRRAESAARTRQAIVEAAVKLHRSGITAMSAVAAEAGVPLPTLNKHFPTREALFGACTRHVAERLTYPLPEALEAIEDRAQRLYAVVWHIFTLHEKMLGYAWTGYKLEDESPTLAGAIADYESLINTLSDVLARDQETLASVIRAMLSPLSYRALRVKEGLDFERAVDQTVRALAKILDIPFTSFAQH